MERTWLQSRKPSALCQVQADDEQIVGLVTQVQERGVQVGLDVHLVQFAEHADDALRHALVVLDQENASAAFRPRPCHGAARQRADLGTGRHAQHHLVVQAS
jgi:hypothetical protein